MTEQNENQPVDESSNIVEGGDDISMTISRRDFIRKSAEVAAMSLFGVVAFDSIVNSVLSAIGEHEAANRLGVAAADALSSSGCDIDGIVDSMCNFTCTYNYSCSTNVTCPQNFSVSDCSKGSQYGCTARQLVCGDNWGGGSFDCYNWFNCWGGGANGMNVDCMTSGMNPPFACNSQSPFHTYRSC